MYRPPLVSFIAATTAKVDSPANAPELLKRTLDHLGSDQMLLFSTDYPHWQFDGDEVLPDGLPDETLRKLLIDNPLDTYPRLREGVRLSDNAGKHEETVR